MKRIGDILATVLDKPTMEKAEGYSAFFSCWKDIIEKNKIPAIVAAHSWIKNLDKGLVWIEVDHPGCKQILQTKERKLLYDFRYRFPDMNISGISIMLCHPSVYAETQKSKPSESVVKDTVMEQEQLAINSLDVSVDDQGENPEYDGIKNMALRKILMRLEKSIVERNSSG